MWAWRRRQLARVGCRVVLTARDEAKEASAAERLSRDGLAVDYRKLDIADVGSIAALADVFRREGVGIHVLVNNASISMDGFNEGVARTTLDVNFLGAVNVTDALLPLVASRGAIVMVSCGLGKVSCLARKLQERFLDNGLTQEGWWLSRSRSSMRSRGVATRRRGGRRRRTTSPRSR